VNKQPEKPERPAEVLREEAVDHLAEMLRKQRRREQEQQQQQEQED
jgi:hypothetical protein